MRLLAFAVGLVLGAWAGFRLWPRTVAAPAFSYTNPGEWVTTTTKDYRITFDIDHPLQ